MSGLGSVLVALAGSSTIAATPALSGVYQVGEVGLVEFSTESGAIVGRYRAGGECGFEPELQVVSGSFEGSVFVGTVLLCQEGPRCPTRRSFPLLAFFRNERLIGSVKFDPGCSSKATDDRRLLFSPATIEEKRAVGSGAVASDVALKKGSQDPQAAAHEAMRAGERKLETGDYREARRAFELAVEYDKGNPKAWMGLGVALVKLKDPEGATRSLERAQALIGQREGDRSGLYAEAQYNLACVLAQEGKKKEALRALSRAARLMGPEVLDQLEHDPDLEAIRSEPEFSRLAADLRIQRAKKGK